MCSCGSFNCACYRRGFRDGFGAGYVSGYTDHALGKPPIPQFAPTINSILRSTPKFEPIKPLTDTFKPFKIDPPILPKFEPIKPLIDTFKPFKIDPPILPKFEPINLL